MSSHSSCKHLATPPRLRPWWRWGFVGGYAACIFVLSSIPGHGLPHVSVSDKMIHVLEFGILAYLLCSALTAHKPHWPSRHVALLSILGTTVYGLTDEFHQWFVPQRSADWLDVLADGLGAILAAFCWFLGQRYRWGNGQREV